ncbi:hypothetical protein [Archangium sp.]|jgi:hypothetical protein|uniref:WD40/YVTN/BNR-like repeat-containing protein n=1 Tax=Archangium sp. TaxID=1872627 RepID=UPI002EDAAC47
MKPRTKLKLGMTCLALCLTATACDPGSPFNSSPIPASEYDDPDAGTPGGPDGGHSSDAGTKDGGTTVTGANGAAVYLPPGVTASSSSLRVAMATDAPALPSSLEARGPVYAFTPHGTTFSAPVTVRVPFDTGAGMPRLYTAQPSGAWEEVAGATVVNGALQAQVTHFSYFAAGTPVVWRNVTGSLTNASYTAFAFLCGGIFAGRSEGVYFSNDLGQTWKAVSTGLPSNPAVRFLAVQSSSLFAATRQGVYRTGCGTLQWTALNGTANGWPQHPQWATPLTSGALGVNGSLLYAGAESASGNPPNAGLYVSSNAGTSWSKLTGYTSYAANDSDVRAIAFLPGKILVGTFYLGVVLSTDGGKTWVNGGFYTHNISNVIALNQSVFVAVTETGLYRSSTGAGDWTRLGGNMLSNYPPLRGLASVGKRLFADLAYLGIRYSDDLGDTWTPYSSGLPMDTFNQYFTMEQWNLATNGTVLIGAGRDSRWSNYPLFVAPLPP